MWITTLFILALTCRAGQTSACLSGCACSKFEYTFKIDCAGYTWQSEDLERLSSEMNLLLPAEEMQRLSSLTVSNIPLDSVPSFVCRSTRLVSLKIDHTSIERLPDNCFANMTQLKELLLPDNHLTELQNGVFDKLDALRTIDFSNNCIKSIGLQVFSNISIMPHLESVTLNSNKLTTLDAWPFIRGVSKLEDLPFKVDVQYNLIRNFTSSLGWEFTCNMRSPSLDMNLSNNRIRHFYDFLNAYGISSYLKIICLKTTRNLRLRFFHNKFVCDCVDFDFYRFMKLAHNSEVLNLNICDEPAALFGRNLFNVALDELVCDVTEKCPVDCHCLYRPSNATLHVYCSDIRFVPNELPPLPKWYDRYYLDLSNNRNLRHLAYRAYFSNVTVLYADNASLETVDIEFWRNVARMKWVGLSGNYLTELPRELIHINLSESTVRLNLGGNPWSCDCTAQWTSDWLNSIADHLVSAENVICETPSKRKGKSARRMTKVDFCTDESNNDSSLAVAIALLIVVVAVLGTTVLCYRLRVRIHARWKLHPFDRDECNGEEMDYDVFLSCDYADHERYARPLLALLEENGFNVCCHALGLRCELGELITDTIVNAVERSKRTLCVVTDNFIQNPCCLYELESAQSHSMNIRHPSRLVVLLACDDPAAFTNGDQVPPWLRHYIRQRKYIEYRDASIENKRELLYALPIRGMLPAVNYGNNGLILN